MKKYITAIICTVLVSFFALGQDACNTYFPFEEGVKFQMTNFNKKGKKESTVDYRITEIKNSVATMEAKIADDKGKEVTTTTYDIACNDDAISIDFKSMMSPEMFKQYKDMDIDMSGTNIEFPNVLKVGQTLKDAQFVMTMNMAGMNMNMTIDMVNRTVEAKETVTTPAGTFDCFVISYDSKMKMGVKHTYKIKEWIAPNVGIVKTASYNKKDKLISYSELTKYSN